MKILNTEMIMKDNSWVTFCVIAFIVLTSITIITFCTVSDEFYKVIFIGLIWLILALPILIVSLVIPKEIPTENYKYEVILDDNYSAKELMNNYEILETRGDIYVIKEKVE